MRRWYPLRSVRTRLSLALALVVAGALAVVWVALVPTLERRLEDGKLAQLTAAGEALRRDARSVGIDQDFVDDAARTATARVVYFEALSGAGTTALLPQYDSQHVLESADLVRDPLARAASATGKVERGTVTRGNKSFAEVAVPDASGNVLLLAAPLHDVLANVRLVRDRVLWAGLAALGFAVLVGFGLAEAFARRIRRLERAAERIASGDFERPVVDRAADELGQLAQAFDTMRLQLARLDGARRAFIANASHELRTPIFSLGGFLELLEDEDLDEETRREFLATASEQVERLSRLATDLLDLSRIDAGHVRPARERVDLLDVAETLRGEFGVVAERLEHPLEVRVDRAGAALGDRERVLRIGRALVDNALIHTPAGTPVHVVVDGQTLAIVDEGPGIPAEHREQVFARFTRLDGSRASGTGLGLAIARELAELMDGELRLETEPGRTAFTLVLPAAAPEPLHAAMA